jgi:hypothetical protein
MSSYKFGRRFILATLPALLLAGGAMVVLANPPATAPRQDAGATVTALLRLQQEVRLTQTAVAQHSATPIVATSTAAPAQTVKPSPTPAPSVAILAPRLTLRAAPGTTTAVLGLAAAGQQFYVTAQAGNCAWLEVVLNDGSGGWVTGDPAMVQLAVPCTALAPVVATLEPTVTPIRQRATATPWLPPTTGTAQAMETELAAELLMIFVQKTATAEALTAATPTIRATATRRPPTSTPTPTRVAATATPTAPPATPTPRPTATANTAAGPYAATILAPNDGQSSRAPLTFAWTADAPLAAGQEFEVVFWNANGESEAQARGWVRSSPQSQALIPADKIPAGAYKWALLLVTTEPYQRLRRLAGPFTFVIPGEGGSGSSPESSDDPAPPPRPGG